MYNDEEQYGMVLISGNICNMYLITIVGQHYDIRRTFSKSVQLQTDFGRGGQSANRIHRIGQQQRDTYVKLMAETMVKKFMKNNNKECIAKHIIIGGPAQMKNKLKEQELVKQYFNNISIVDTPEINDSMVDEVYKQYSDKFNPDNRHIIDQIDKLISLADDKLVFKDEIISNMENCMLEKIFIDVDILRDMYEEINKLNTYGCIIEKLNTGYLKQYGGIIGVKWY